MPKIKKIKLANKEYDIAVDKDWDQNDDTAVDYIKNRPFYTKDDQSVVQLPTKYIPVDDDTIKVEAGKLTAKLSEPTYETVIGGKSSLANVSTNKDTVTYLNFIKDGAIKSQHAIIGTNGATVTSDANGDITIDTAKVEWEQINQSGVEIARITIGETETVVYAPQPTGSGGGTTYTLKVGGANNANHGKIDRNGSVYLKLVDGAGTVVNQYSITGDGGATVTSDKDGNITFYNPPAAEIAPNLNSKDTTKVETLKIYETTREDYESATNIEDTSFYLVPDPPAVTIVDGTGEVVEVETLKIYTTTKEQYESTPEADLEDNSLYLIPDPSAWTIETKEDTGHVDLIVADKTEYYLPNATSLSITGAANPHYECWISTGSNITTITFSEGMECIGIDSRELFYEVNYVEISIKDGKYVIGAVGTN